MRGPKCISEVKIYKQPGRVHARKGMSLRRRAATAPGSGFCVKDGVYGFSSDFRAPTMVRAPVVVQAPTQAACGPGVITSNRQAQEHMESYLMAPATMDAAYTGRMDNGLRGAPGMVDAVYMYPGRVGKELADARDRFKRTAIDYKKTKSDYTIADKRLTSDYFTAHVAHANQLIFNEIESYNHAHGTHHLRPIDIFRTTYTARQLKSVRDINPGVVARYEDADRRAKQALHMLDYRHDRLPNGAMALYIEACRCIHALEAAMAKHGIPFKGAAGQNQYSRLTRHHPVHNRHPQQQWGHRGHITGRTSVRESPVPAHDYDDHVHPDG